jgi:4-carboxymuconolactone decarboxylase
MRSQLTEYAELNDEQRKVWDENMSSPRGVVSAPVRVWLKSPEMALRATRLGTYLKFDSAVPKVAAEVAILYIARQWNADYQWQAHEVLAREAGVDASVISALQAREQPQGLDERSQVAYDIAKSLNDARTVSDELFLSAAYLLGEAGLVDLIALCGYYTTVAMTLNAFDMGLPPPGEQG